MNEKKNEGLYLPDSEDYSKSSSTKKMTMGWVTKLILFLCSSLFLSSTLWEANHPVPQEASGIAIYRSPITRSLLYDYPLIYQLINRLIDLDGYESLEENADLSPKGKILKKHIESLKTWNGFYSLLIQGDFKDLPKEWKQRPTFEKIHQGELWRLFTPCLLHGDILHILFNMMWLLGIGSQIERRLKTTRYLFLIIFVAILSNTTQYLMSGPNFLGFSGVICGMLGFMWVRKKKAPWESYRIDHSTFIYMLIFVLGMAALDGLAFLLEKFYHYSSPFYLANSAHISGGIAGWLLGQSKTFNDWRNS